MKKSNIDIYEQEWLGALNAGKLKPAKNSETANMLKKAAESYQKKDKRANIRISAWVLDELKYQASKLGLPIQTYMSSLLYRQAVTKAPLAT